MLWKRAIKAKTNFEKLNLAVSEKKVFLDEFIRS